MILLVDDEQGGVDHGEDMGNLSKIFSANWVFTRKLISIPSAWLCAY